MAYTKLDLPADPEAAVSLLQQKSQETPVFVFKFSPICPVSTMAEGEFKRFLKALPEDDQDLLVAWIDVIDQKPLARGLTAALSVAHQSPQALLFRGGELEWNDSHGELTQDTFDELVSE